MTNKTIIQTANAPKAIGTYSQAVKAGETVYLSGQIAFDPVTMEVVSDDFAEQAKQVFENVKAVVEAAGGSLSDVVKLNIFLEDLGNFTVLNEIMGQYFSEPYPARAAVQVAALPLGVKVEIDGVMVLGS